jgi:hypothetical protein
LKDEGLAIEDAFERREQAMTLLAVSRQIAPHATEAARTVRRSKAARDSLLDFDHPQVAFRPVIVERHTPV